MPKSNNSKDNHKNGKRESTGESSSSSSLPKPEFEVGKIIARKWQIIEQLGSGGCGVVYRVMKVNSDFVDDSAEVAHVEAKTLLQFVSDTTSGNMAEAAGDDHCSDLTAGMTAAIKAESTDPDNSRYHETLRIEAMVLRRLQWSSHACRLFMAGRISSYVNAIVMTETGPSLSRLRRQCPNQHFTLSTAIRIGIQCINAVEDLHCIGFIHRDIKPSNFAIGLRHEKRRLYLLDFGLSRAYLAWDENGKLKHRTPRGRAHFLGTERYCSPNVHERVDQGRRDDMWSIFFSIIEMIRGKLPWRNAECSTQVFLGKTYHLSYLLERCPPELRAFAAHIKSLEYTSVPDYSYLRGCLETLCNRRDFRFNDPYDWEKGGRFHKRSFKNFFS